MHEMSLAEGIMQIVETQSKGHGNKVTKVILSLGELAGVEKEALEFGFEVVSNGTIAHGAILEYHPVSGSAFCFNCCAQVPLSKQGNPCPRCDGYQLTVIDGTQMQVKSMELE
ncbi:hydrogenase maturation nickel metallochaperone HypA [Ferrimonas lipolytica]|uniref:Hydrogenase maturation factor HypA n=1 Tax=Ferrimonas lipolytica TaxID=2724191 RepID=A0A6H1UCW6_9GAMM|nr:hydrogenase maturation nickel metallochaperone HypA [Ferrimonas lipolytica]QIZ76430.1 hydrogenase maturation nickel metallochaperone HypA [Ferrimonas lipolytica]